MALNKRASSNLVVHPPSTTTFYQKLVVGKQVESRIRKVDFNRFSGAKWALGGLWKHFQVLPY